MAEKTFAETLKERLEGTSTFGADGSTVHTADLSDGFFDGVRDLAQTQNIDGNDLLRMWMNESGIQSSRGSNQKNNEGNPVAYGLNQILGSTLKGWGIDPLQFLTLSAEDQLPTVARYYQPYHGASGARLYQVNFLPATLPWGSDPDLVLLYADPSQRTEHVGWISPATESLFYRSNKGLDHGAKGYINVQDLDIALHANDNNPRLLEAIDRLGTPSSDPPYNPPSSPPSGKQVGAGFFSGGSFLFAALGIGAAYLAVKSLKGRHAKF